jgi:hypothetical protein
MPGQLFAKVFDEITKRFKSLKLDKSHQVPYLGGMSKDRDIAYIDSRIPDTMEFEGKTYNINLFLCWHECVEKTIMDLLGLSYNEAHHEAEWAETQLIQASGLNPKPYHEYISKTYPWTLVHFDPNLVPSDLDLKPYVEDRKYDVINKILKARKGFYLASKSCNNKKLRLPIRKH